MLSFTKIAFASVIAYSIHGRSVHDDDVEYNKLFGRANSWSQRRTVPSIRGKTADLFDDDTPYYFGKCCVKDADGVKKGKVILHQEAESKYSSVSARVRGAGADRVAIELYDSDPSDLDADQRIANFGEFRPNRRKVIQFFGLYNDDAQIQGDTSIAGKFIGVRCV